MRLNIWPWSRIRELEAVLEKTRELLRLTEEKCEEQVGNCAKEIRFFEGENRQLEAQNRYLKDECDKLWNERNLMLDILALPPKWLKLRRVKVRRQLNDSFCNFRIQFSPYSLWIRKIKNGFKVYSPAELPEPLGACPRCSHSDAELIRTEDGLHYVQCRKCGAMTDDCKHAEDAAQLWNEGRVLDE